MQDWSIVTRYFETDAVAHLATLDRDGGPHSVPLWIDLHVEGTLAFFSVADTRKDRNIARDPRVALSITDPGNPFDMASVRGEVIERIEGEQAMAIVDRLARKYTGEAYDLREGLVAFIVRPTRWWARDYSGE